MNIHKYQDWKTVMSQADKFWMGLTPSEVLLAQEGEAALFCLLRKKYGLNDSEVGQQISEYLSKALS